MRNKGDESPEVPSPHRSQEYPTLESARTREASPNVLATLHAGSDLRKVTKNPKLRSWLSSHPIPVPKAAVPDSLFNGTLVFARVTYNRPNEPPFAANIADVQTAMNYATLAVVPIQRYASQYGTNSIAVSPNIISFTVNLTGDTFPASDVDGWVDQMVHDNRLSNACIVMVHDRSVATSPTNLYLNGKFGGYHSMTGNGNPYCFVHMFGQNLTIADRGNVYVENLSHEIAEMAVIERRCKQPGGV